jgi:hypothetical protein
MGSSTEPALPESVASPLSAAGAMTLRSRPMKRIRSVS